MNILEKAHAKINLFLGIKGMRADGYHEIETVFQSLALHDLLRVEAAAGLSLSVSSPGLSGGPDNLVWRAAVLLKKHCGVAAGAKIHLTKNIPVAAGLGGGSSDAAAVLRGLCRLWQLRPKRDMLHRLAAELGSDVPFCLEGGTALGQGRGEVLTKLAPVPKLIVVLANPGYPLSTAVVYSAYNHEADQKRPGVEAMLQAVRRGDRQAIGALLYNSLEGSAFSLCPELVRLKERMATAGAALLSGSGPTMFVLCSDRERAQALCSGLAAMGMGAWLTETWPGEKLEVP